ncbi:MAG TPA: cellulase family glycosylhydrolase, partial [Anaerolineales bacterium]|nr:cellulase family glycosylhydrolase [Anaerolineales bacterium]
MDDRRRTMKRFTFLSFLLLLIFSACVPASLPPTSTPTAHPTETPMPPTSTPEPTDTPEPTSTPLTSMTLQRGVNFGNMLEAPNEGEWGLTVREEYFDLVKETGFDFVRLPVRWFAHTTDTGHDDGDIAHEITPAFFARVDEVVGWGLERNLKIIIDFHHYDELMSNP